MAQDDLRAYRVENQRRKALRKQEQKKWAEYLHKQAEEKRRREKLEFERNVNFDNLIVQKDHLRVEQDHLKKATLRKLKVQVIKEN